MHLIAAVAELCPGGRDLFDTRFRKVVLVVVQSIVHDVEGDTIVLAVDDQDIGCVHEFRLHPRGREDIIGQRGKKTILDIHGDPAMIWHHDIGSLPDWHHGRDLLIVVIIWHGDSGDLDVRVLGHKEVDDTLVGRVPVCEAGVPELKLNDFGFCFPGRCGLFGGCGGRRRPRGTRGEQHPGNEDQCQQCGQALHEYSSLDRERIHFTSTFKNQLTSSSLA